MKILSFVNRKGGCGKSSLICLLALYWAESAGKSTAIRDLDPQGSSKAFAELMNHPGIAVYKRGGDCDYLLVDTPGGIRKKDLNELMEISNLVIVPLSLSPTDIRSSAETVQLINAPAKSRLLFNQVNTQTSAFKERESFAQAIGLKSLDSYLSKRISFSYALVEGWNVLNPKAAAELEQLAKEVEKCLK